MSAQKYKMERMTAEALKGKRKLSAGELRRIRRQQKHVEDEDTWLVEAEYGTIRMTAKQVRHHNENVKGLTTSRR